MRTPKKAQLRNLPKDELEKELNRLEKRGLGNHRKAKYIKYQLKKRNQIHQIVC